MKILLALALVSLCMLALLTVRLRNQEFLAGYRIAALQRDSQRLRDHLMALRAQAAAKAAGPQLLQKAMELNIVLCMDGFDRSQVMLVDVNGTKNPTRD